MPATNITMIAVWETEYTYIKTANEFQNIANNLSGKYCLLNNINLGTSWTPMGSKYWTHSTTSDNPSQPFRGILDGNGYTITYQSTIDNLFVDYDYGWGLFGSSNGAYFLNLTLNAVVKSYPNSEKTVDCYECCVGTFVGLATDSKFENCCTTASSSITNQDSDRTYYVFLVGMVNTGATYSGGFVGDARSCIFSNCKNASYVYSLGYQAYSGGIAGNAYGCTISNCTNSGSITSSHGGWIWGIDGNGSLFGKTAAPWLRSDGGSI